jgi:hypothetical protein
VSASACVCVCDMGERECAMNEGRADYGKKKGKEKDKKKEIENQR